MWIVFEMEGLGLTDELAKLWGPFDTRAEAEAYCIQIGGDGIMEIERPAEWIAPG